MTRLVLWYDGRGGGLKEKLLKPGILARKGYGEIEGSLDQQTTKTAPFPALNDDDNPEGSPLSEFGLLNEHVRFRVGAFSISKKLFDCDKPRKAIL